MRPRRFEALKSRSFFVHRYVVQNCDWRQLSKQKKGQDMSRLKSKIARWNKVRCNFLPSDGHFLAEGREEECIQKYSSFHDLSLTAGLEFVYCLFFILFILVIFPWPSCWTIEGARFGSTMGPSSGMWTFRFKYRKAIEMPKEPKQTSHDQSMSIIFKPILKLYDERSID